MRSQPLFESAAFSTCAVSFCLSQQRLAHAQSAFAWIVGVKHTFQLFYLYRSSQLSVAYICSFHKTFNSFPLRLKGTAAWAFYVFCKACIQYTDSYCSSCSCLIFLEAKYCIVLPFIEKSLYSHFYLCLSKLYDLHLPAAVLDQIKNIFNLFKRALNLIEDDLFRQLLKQIFCRILNRKS
jgi:hypothetical protein